MPFLRFAVASVAILASTPSFYCHAFTSGPSSLQQQQQQQQASQKSTATFSHDNNDWFVTYADVEESNNNNNIISSRRSFVAVVAAAATAVAGAPLEANAAADCMKECFKQCKLIAPKDPEYCQSSCGEYCKQSDRTDGLSGSVSSEGGETGILGMNTVPKGEDKPPEVKLPGLDFSSGKGKKLLGY
mmetsp:Transcript_16562/g.29968  ORF Transcript_16562/g.29968 Transcript_16562/m.29968 type:complete len:187 (+) Transcript_16562:81-641(+)